MRTVYAIRRRDAKHWPCPWITLDRKGCASVPIAWPLEEAKEYARAHGLGVYRIARGRQIEVTMDATDPRADEVKE